MPWWRSYLESATIEFHYHATPQTSLAVLKIISYNETAPQKGSQIDS